MQFDTGKLNLRTFSLFDCHVHVGSWDTKEFLGRTTTLKESCDVLVKSGVTGALVMPTDTQENKKLLEQVQKHDGQPPLFFCAWVDPRDDDIFDFLQKNRREVFAFKIHPSFARLPVDDKAFYPFLELAQTFSVPVVVHCGRWREVAGYEHVLNVAKMFRKVHFILSHMGGDSPPLVLGAASDILDNGVENCFLGTESIREYWLIEKVIKILGAERLVFGSDHNLNHPSTFIATIEALNISPNEKAMIFGLNAMALLAKKAS
jgi:predicted TIM-barrel fold metal-dependent hydrolase